MEDTRWVRLVTIGLVLAAIAVGYFLVAQRFSGSKVSNSETKIVQASPVPASVPTPTPSATPGKASSAYQTVAERTRDGAQTLPATGSPALLVGLLAAAAVVAGLGLRKFPK